MQKIDIRLCDITTLEVDVIVNAANSTLLGGGGVDGAIHRAAGKELVEECKTVAPCPTGEARLTRGYKLPAKWVIHTVGPIWRGGRNKEAELLASCYRKSLALAEKIQASSIAFPAISCGVYGYPHEQACTIAYAEVTGYLDKSTTIRQVVFACFSKEMVSALEQTATR